MLSRLIAVVWAVSLGLLVGCGGGNQASPDVGPGTGGTAGTMNPGGTTSAGGSSGATIPGGTGGANGPNGADAADSSTRDAATGCITDDACPGPVMDAGTGCPPAPAVFPPYPSQLLTDPATGCVVSVLYTNSDAGVSCPPLNLPPTLCLSSLLPVSDPTTGCATGFRCAFPSDCALGAGCPTTDAGIACPPVVFPPQFCVVLLTVVDPTTGCVGGFTCKGIVP